MGFINKIEQGLEKAVRGTFAKGGSQFEPVDLANRVRTEMDNKAYSISSDRMIAPNVFSIDFAAEDFPRVQSWGAPLAEELCDVVIRHARAQGYSLRGSVRVTFSVDDAVAPGDFMVDSSQEKVATPQNAPAKAAHASSVAPGEPSSRGSSRAAAPAAPAQRPASYPSMGEDDLPQRITKPAPRAPRTTRAQEYNEPPTQMQPRESARVAPSSYNSSYAPQPQVVLEINGQNYSCNSLPVVLGRSSRADITVEDTGVSRRHLEIMEQDGVYLAIDLGSTNGSYLNGEPLVGRRQLTHGSVLSMGRARIVFRLMIPRSGR
ncbi:MAG: DUF3662 and FHA domain-containing protein [Rothia sp. (in: high G+C Gram-positive bacteria)]|nr:DUF3662 and FHA domain-containing protein [Rothia sp. (in: high G+C Gram-positive bacteria)]